MGYEHYVVNLLTFSTGNAYSWSSPVVPKLTKEEGLDYNPLGRVLDTNELAWMVALVPLGAIFGCPFGGSLASKFGKKNALLLSGIPMLVSFLITTFSTNIILYFIAKFIGGVACGSCFTLVPLYVGEISDKMNRGKLGCFFGIFLKMGTAFSYFVGPFCSVQLFSFICAIPVLIFLITLHFFFPETPYHLVSTGNCDDAEKVLKKLRKKEDETTILNELNEITQYIKENQANNRDMRILIKNKATKKSLIISTGLLSIQQLSAIVVVISYTQTIYQEAGSEIPSEYASMATGLIQILSSCITSQFVDRFGRRILLIISTGTIGLSLFSLGTYFFLKHNDVDVEQVYWLPLASLALYCIAYCVGIGPVVWAMVGEIFDSNCKSFGSSVANCVSKIMAFAVTLVFPYLSKYCGMEASFWLIASFMFLGLIFTILFVPETKCKSFSEIKTMLEKRTLQIC